MLLQQANIRRHILALLAAAALPVIWAAALARAVFFLAHLH
jgi:hypothetical protein